MPKNRLETFIDVLLAILIGVMLNGLHPPSGAGLDDLRPLLSPFLAYLLSFLLLGVYWRNYRLLLEDIQQIHSAALWANLHLLFWLSLTPFAAAWSGANPQDALPAVLYGAVQICAALAFYLLARALSAANGGSLPARMNSKGKVSLILFVVALPLAFNNPLGSYALYLVVALMWLIPSKSLGQPPAG